MPLKCTKSIPASLVRSLKISSGVGGKANALPRLRAVAAPILTKPRRLMRFLITLLPQRQRGRHESVSRLELYRYCSACSLPTPSALKGLDQLKINSATLLTRAPHLVATQRVQCMFVPPDMSRMAWIKQCIETLTHPSLTTDIDLPGFNRWFDCKVFTAPGSQACNIRKNKGIQGVVAHDADPVFGLCLRRVELGIEMLLKHRSDV